MTDPDFLPAQENRLNQLLQTFSLETAVIRPIEGYFYRTVNYKYSAYPLSTRGAELTGGRYNFKPNKSESISCFYCADYEHTAFTEKFYRLKIANQPRPPHTTFGLEIKLSRLLDLRTLEFCQQAQIDRNAIDEPWEYYQDILRIPSYTQRIAMIAYSDGGIEGILYTSTKVKDATCIAIYPERMLSSSYIAVYDPNNELKIPDENKFLRGLSGFVV